jgi:hypothetical protein
MEDVLDHVGDGVLVVDADWRVARANAVAATQLDADVATLVGADVREAFPQSVDATFHGHFGGDDPEPAAVSFEDYFPDLGTWFAVGTEPTDEGLVVTLRDVTDRRELERTVERREGELGRLTRINATIQEIIRDLVGATTREEVEETVCERLAASALYEFVWVGERNPTGDRITDRVAAGEFQGVVDLLAEGGESPDSTESPEQTVVRTGETRLVRRLVEDDSVPESIRRVAFARGLQSALAVPVRYGSTTYGVLGVYATRPDAFSDRERESLETLGVVTGFVINAARQRNLLLSDTVVELGFRVTDLDDALVALSARFDCSLAIEGVVPRSEDELLCYVSADGVRPGRLRETAAAGDAGLGSVRVVHEASEEEDDEGGLVELTLAGSSPLLTLVAYGATIRTATFEDGVGRIAAEVAPDADVRAVVEAVAREFPGSELLAKRERQRTAETAQEFRSALHDRLTERQRTAIRVAYHGGYFESPRDSTAEELAAGLGISSPTLHYHLRAAQWKLVDAFLDEDPGQRRPDAAEWHEGGHDGDG